jgi:uncharacterized protein (UPF0276 family)
VSAAAAWPRLGAGIAYRTPLHGAIVQHLDALDCLEILVEDLLSPPDRIEHLAGIVERVPVVLHGVSFSLGSTPNLSERRRRQLRTVARRVGARWFGEHISFTNVGDTAIPIFTPTPFSAESAAVVRANAALVGGALDLPVLLEPIAYQFVPPGSTLGEREFIAAVLDHGPFGLLLDLTNVYLNALNHGYDAGEFIDALALDRVVQVHLAGSRDGIGGRMLDSPDGPVPEPVWRLLEHVAGRCRIACVIVERESNFPPMAELVDEVRRARAICGFPEP